MKRMSRVLMIMVSAVALLSLGAPSAFAVAPTITSFSPTNGPAGCVVVITGTSFTDFPAAQTTVTFVSPASVETPATDFAIVSPTEIWATVPVLTAGTGYNIRIANPAGISTSTGPFLSTLGAGACAPTITSFAPTSGPVGTTVTIVGTNLLKDSNTGGDVKFFDNKMATHSGAAESPAQLSVVVPAGATTGPISVTTPIGTATSVTNFTVVGEPIPGVSPIEVFTNTEPEICAVVGPEGGTAMPTAVTVGAQSRLLIYFTSERSGFDIHTELLVTFEVLAGDNVVASTPFEWGNLGVALRGHTSGTVMWPFADVSPGNYTVRVGARVDPLPGPLGGGTPTAVLENCALTVFVIPDA
jgi:IPT/TIG domain